MGLIRRLFGICSTPLLQDPSAWTVEEDELVLDLSRTSMLQSMGSAVRIEDEALAERVLVVHGHDDTWHAYPNRCMHAGRRLDPLPDRPQLECCSVGKSTYDLEGHVRSGSAKDDVCPYVTRRDGGLLRITMTRSA